MENTCSPQCTVLLFTAPGDINAAWHGLGHEWGCVTQLHYYHHHSPGAPLPLWVWLHYAAPCALSNSIWAALAASCRLHQWHPSPSPGHDLNCYCFILNCHLQPGLGPPSHRLSRPRARQRRVIYADPEWRKAGVVSQPGVTAPLNWTNYAANVAHSPSFTRFLYTMDGWMVHQTIDPTLANTSDLLSGNIKIVLLYTSGKEIHATICFGYLHYLLSLSHVCHWLLESPLMVHFTRRNVEKW